MTIAGPGLGRDVLWGLLGLLYGFLLLPLLAVTWMGFGLSWGVFDWAKRTLGSAAVYLVYIFGSLPTIVLGVSAGCAIALTAKHRPLRACCVFATVACFFPLVCSGTFYMAIAVEQVVGLAVTILAGWLVVRARRPQPGHCVNCKYDLTGDVSGVCPECGCPVEGTGSSRIGVGKTG